VKQFIRKFSRNHQYWYKDKRGKAGESMDDLKRQLLLLAATVSFHCNSLRASIRYSEVSPTSKGAGDVLAEAVFRVC
jgi:hypothetical protein